MRRGLWKKISAAALALCMAGSLGACGKKGNTAVRETDVTAAEQEGARDSVIVVMGPTSEPEAGFDPAYGWGAGEHEIGRAHV